MNTHRAFLSKRASDLPVLTMIFVLPLLISCGSTAVQSSQSIPTTIVQESVGALPTPTLIGTPGVPAYLLKMVVLGVVIGEKGIVLQVEEKSGAEQAGIQVGDEIKAINGVDLEKNREEGKNQIRFIKPGDKVKVKVKKSKQSDEVEVEVTPQFQGSPLNRETPTPVPPPEDYL